MKFPLLKNDNELDELLTDMLGPEQAKKIMYGSDHASHIVDQSEIAYSQKGVEHMGEHLNAESTKEEKHEVLSVAGGRNVAGKQGSIKSKSTLRNKDEISIGGHRSEVGGARSPKKMRWNSTK